MYGELHDIAGQLGPDGALGVIIPVGEREFPASAAMAYRGQGDFLFLRASYASGYPRVLGRVISTFEPVSVANGKAQVRWKATPGKTYEIERADDLSAPVWIPLETRDASRSVESVEDIHDVSSAAGRYYRISERS